MPVTALTSVLLAALVTLQEVAPTPVLPVQPRDPTIQPLNDAVTQAIRNCPQTRQDEIAVCARDRGFAEKYRIQKLDRPTVDLGDPKVKLSGVGSDVPGQCSTVGQAGAIGCSKRDYDNWAAWKREQRAAARDTP